MLQTLFSTLPAEVTRELMSNESVELVQDTEEFRYDEINYILEKASPRDIEQGIIVTGPSDPLNTPSGYQDMILISF